MSLNLVTLVGRAGRDPELRYYDSGRVVCHFSIAVNRRRKDDDQPDWFELEIWGRTAEIAGDYVRKGSLVGITGSFRFDRWKDKTTGEDRQRPIISVDRLDLLGSRQDRESASVPDEEF
jgi:single-strand DNA-binding protein